MSRFRLGLISFVGLFNLAIGGLFVALGLWILLAGADAVAAIFQTRQHLGEAVAELPVNPQAAKTFDDYVKLASQGLSGLVLALASVVAGCSIVQGLPLVLVGAGVLLRQRWARVFALFFAVLALIEGTACLFGDRTTPLVVLSGGVLLAYGIITFVGLLGRPANDFFAGRDLASTSESAKPTGKRPIAVAAGVLLLIGGAVGLAGWYLSRPGAGPIAQGPGGGKDQPKPPDVVDDKPIPPDTSGKRYQQQVAALSEAVRLGQTDRVLELTKDGKGVNNLDDKRESPLMWAVDAGQVHLPTILIRQGAQYSVRDKDGNDLLLYAAARGKLKWLADAIPRKVGNSVSARELQLSNEDRGDRWCDILVDNVNNKGMTAAMLAAANGHREELEWIVTAMWIANGPRWQSWALRKDRHGKTALDHAKAGKHADCVKYLEALEAGETPLMLAATRNDGSGVLLFDQFTESGTSGRLTEIAVTDKQQRTALHYAAQSGDTKTITRLLKGAMIGFNHPRDGAFINWFRIVTARDDRGWTAADYAEQGSHADAAAMLKQFVPQNFATLSGTYNQTVLELACLDGDVALVKDLLNAGCPRLRPADAYKSGLHTPLMIAADRGYTEVARALLDPVGFEKGQREEFLNMRRSDGKSALDLAVAANQKPVAVFLRQSGAKEK